MKKYYTPVLTGIAVLLIASSVLLAQPESYSNEHPGNTDRSEIKLTWENPHGKPFNIITTSESPVFRNFAGKYGDWTFLVNSLSGNISRAFGNPVKLEGIDVVSRTNVINASQKFINSNPEIFSAGSGELRLSRVDEVNGRWYVGYKQYYKGLEVLLSDVELRIFANGNLSNFEANNFMQIDADVNSVQITPSEASDFAAVGVKFNSATDQSETEKEMFILPYFKNSKTEYRLVYKVNIATAEPYARYFAYVDASSGEVLWRQNTVYNENKITTHGTIKKRFGTDPFVDNPFADMDIVVNGVTKPTNADGEIDYDQTDSITVNAKFTGKWAKVTMKSGAPRTTADFTAKIKGGQDFDLLWSDSNSHKSERNLFYHANWVHDYVRAIDTLLSVMDFQLNVTIDFKGTSPNAYSNGQSIGYIGVGVAEMRLPEVASVLYHEYGHSVNALLYQKLGKTNGMINLSANEGTADLFSSLIQDEPRMGVGAWTYDSAKIIRTLDNQLKYPYDLQSDGHHNGQILGGAFWDLRKATNLDYVRHLAHYTKYGLPDDANIGIAFSEWFFDALNTDDDDGNLANGTPHAMEIIKAFNGHNIGTNLLLQLGFTHTPYKNTLETKLPYEIVFTLKALSFAGATPDSVYVVWSVDNFQTLNYAYAVADSVSGKYKALIPAQKAGSVVQYYMSAYEPLSRSSIKFYKNFDSYASFRFLVGYTSVFYDNFETNNGWVSGSTSDDATRGKWELGIPNLIDMSLYGLGVLQPGKDHSEQGLNCWVTGAKGNMTQYLLYMPNGRTTLTSPDFQLKDMTLPIVKYYEWFYNVYGYPAPGYETYWETDLSFDGGLSWTRVERTSEPTDQWEDKYIILSNYLPAQADSFRLRFVFDVPKYTNNPFSLSEGLVDDFEILSVDPSLVSVGETTNDGIRISPNPAKDYIEINLSGVILSAAKNPDIRIFDLLGTEVLSNSQLSIVNSQLRIDVSSLPPGMYFVRVGNEVRKFVKM